MFIFPYSSNLLFELKQHKQTKHSSVFKKPPKVPKKAQKGQNKPKTWECYACGLTKSNEHDLMEHVLNDHKKARGAKKCEECGKTFQKHILLLEHLAKVHEKEMRFYCDYCDAHTKTLNVLKQHKRREHSMEIVKENSDPQSITTTSGMYRMFESRSFCVMSHFCVTLLFLSLLLILVCNSCHIFIHFTIISLLLNGPSGMCRTFESRFF